MKLPFWKKSLFTLILFLGVMLVLEVVLRIAGLGPAPAPQPIDPHSDDQRAMIDAFEYFAVTDRNLGFRNRPDGQYVTHMIEGTPLATTDEHGYRNGAGWPGQANTPIVLFVGDSTTFCSEVPDENTNSSETAKLLDAAGYRVRVINAGTRGYGTLQVRRMVEECLDRHPEIRVVVYTFCGNDPKESLVPGLYYPNVVPLVRLDDRTGRYEAIDLIDTPFPEDEGIFDIYYLPPKPPWYVSSSRWMARRSVVWHFADLGVERVGMAWRRLTRQKPQSEPPPEEKKEAPAQKKESPDMMLYYPPDVRDYAMRHGFPTTGGILPPWQQKYWDDWARTNHGPALLGQLLGEINTLCKEHDARLITTSYYYDESTLDTALWFEKICNDADISYASLAEGFDATGKSGKEFLARRIDGRYDSHYNEQGTATFAEIIAPVIEKALKEQGIKPTGE